MSSNLLQAGDDCYSYGTCIRTVLEVNGISYSVGNVTKYSPTTSKHQAEANVHNCEIQVSDLPRKATAKDLRTKALAFLMEVA